MESGLYGIGVGVGVVEVCGANSIQSRFWPSPWNESFRVCVPAESGIGVWTKPLPVPDGVIVAVTNDSVSPTSRYVSNEPVLGTVIVDFGTPSTESVTMRPLFGLAMRAVTV